MFKTAPLMPDIKPVEIETARLLSSCIPLPTSVFCSHCTTNELPHVVIPSPAHSVLMMMDVQAVTQSSEPSKQPKRFLEQVHDTIRSISLTGPAQFCERCIALDLERLLLDSYSRGTSSQDVRYQKSTLLSPLGDPLDWKDADCPLCRFFYAHWQLTDRGINTTSAQQKLYALSTTQQDGKKEWTTVLAIHGGAGALAYIYAVDLSLPPHSTCGGDASLNYDLLMTWMGKCRDDHEYCRKNSGYHQDEHGTRVLTNGESWIQGMKLVDCFSRIIVKAETHHRYAALSYVWGILPQPDLNDFISNQLPDELPPLIEDAITVTKGIQLRYLWVDRYCISIDENVRHHQIRNMDSMYGRAEVTLILASGDTSSGIHGVSVPRLLQPRLRLGSLELRSSLKCPKPTLRRSRWNSRGWTYQEALLSRRRLIFTEDQVTFDCPLLWVSEGVPQNQFDRDLERSDRVRFETPPSQFSPIHRAHDCKDKIEGYTQRKFTFQNDRLNGFLGIFKAFSKLKTPTRHIWGIPVHVRSSTAREVPSCGTFLASLCWDVPRPSQRLVGFPSWCWTGWVGSVRFNHPHRLVDKVDVSLEMTDGLVLTWDEALTLMADYDGLALSTCLHLHVWTFEVRFKTASAARANGGSVAYCVESVPDVLLSLTMEVEDHNALHERLRTLSWVCVVLGRTAGGRVQCAIVVDFVQNMAFRIGYLKFHGGATNVEEVKRKIRIS